MAETLQQRQKGTPAVLSGEFPGSFSVPQILFRNSNVVVSGLQVKWVCCDAHLRNCVTVGTDLI
jgi:hypothetical protein